MTVQNYRNVLNQVNVQGSSAVVQVHVAPATRPTVTRPTNLPPPSSRFVGRERELETIARAFDAGAPGAGTPVCLTGMGGVGKTHLARAFGYAHLAEYERICWLNAEAEDLTAAMGA